MTVAVEIMFDNMKITVDEMPIYETFLNFILL